MPENPKAFLRSLTPLPEEFWCFTDWELRHPHACRRNDAFVARIDFATFRQMAPELEPKGIIVRRDGRATNFWEDGTEGVPETLQQHAEHMLWCEKSVYFGSNFAAHETDELASVWRFVRVNKDDTFSSFKPDALSVIENELSHSI